MFKFSLQRLLDLKAAREREMAKRLAVALDAAATEAARAQSLADLQTSSTEHVAAAAAASPSVGELVAMRTALTQMQAHRDMANARVEEAQDEVSSRTGEFTAAVQQRHMLDKLRDRQFEQHREVTHRAEQAGMDEVALRRFTARQLKDDSSTEDT